VARVINGSKIKWPNDVLLGDKKVCGVLTEMTAETDRVDKVIIGIGINVNNEVFGVELIEKATSLYRESGVRYDREELITKGIVLGELNIVRDDPNVKSMRENYINQVKLAHEQIFFDTKVFEVLLLNENNKNKEDSKYKTFEELKTKTLSPKFILNNLSITKRIHFTPFKQNQNHQVNLNNTTKAKCRKYKEVNSFLKHSENTKYDNCINKLKVFPPNAIDKNKFNYFVFSQ
jgi:hypothetical protein